MFAMVIPMRVARGRVSGRTVILEEDLPDGAAVDVRLVDDDAEGVEVTDAEWTALMEAAQSVRRGEVVDAKTVLAALGR
jgi:hypothetical protein